MKIKSPAMNPVYLALWAGAFVLIMGCTPSKDSNPVLGPRSDTIKITPHTRAVEPLPAIAGGDVGHLQDLERGMKTLPQNDLRNSFERAFRMTFSRDKTKRNYAEAKGLFEGVLRSQPKHPQTLRGLGYVALNQGMQMNLAIAYYRRAIQADKNYGDAHYGLAFLYGVSEPARGIGHYRQAMALGIKDTRNLAKKFYGEWLAPPPKIDPVEPTKEILKETPDAPTNAKPDPVKKDIPPSVTPATPKEDDP